MPHASSRRSWLGRRKCRAKRRRREATRASAVKGILQIASGFLAYGSSQSKTGMIDWPENRQIRIVRQAQDWRSEFIKSADCVHTDLLFWRMKGLDIRSRFGV